MRHIVIGDIHGCYDELLSLLSKLDWQSKTDRVFLLGDLIHKGPKSGEVLQFAYENDFQVILGNHDHYFLSVLCGESDAYLGYNEILENSKIKKEDLLRWIKDWPLYIDHQSFFLIHAGLDPDMNCLEKRNLDICLNIRYWDHNNGVAISDSFHKGPPIGCLPWFEDFVNPFEVGKVILFGHWAKKEIVISEDQSIYGLDTGCCYGGKLTAYVVEEKRFVQVNSLQKKQFDY